MIFTDGHDPCPADSAPPATQLFYAKSKKTAKIALENQWLCPKEPYFRAMNLAFKKWGPKDIEALLAIGRKTFKDAFELQNKAEDFKTYMDVAFSREQLLRQLKEKDSAFYLALRGKTPCGYLKVNQNEAQTDLKWRHGMELERIYVLQEHQNMGYGHQMVRKALDLAMAANKSCLWLGVWEKNLRAIAFYEKLGFTKFGSHPYHIGSDKQTDWLMKYNVVCGPRETER
ncbi:GNAT family N-acetyltransferase [Maribacter sp. 2307ULW6-5]|uniref:GNAT family N-acetyltransferase n=1 Tax=Maribacter sp. 2307ULW6-5 TaxID=3386275 RepID=UPI0039BCF3B7